MGQKIGSINIDKYVLRNAGVFDVAEYLIASPGLCRSPALASTCLNQFMTDKLNKCLQCALKKYGTAVLFPTAYYTIWTLNCVSKTLFCNISWQNWIGQMGSSLLSSYTNNFLYAGQTYTGIYWKRSAITRNRTKVYNARRAIFAPWEVSSNLVISDEIYTRLKLSK